jgi:hypothetical protein
MIYFLPIIIFQPDTSITAHESQQVDHTSMTPVPFFWNPPMMMDPPENAIEFTL